MNEANKGSLKIGSILNEKCVVLEFIGKGGMGEVYRAHQINLKRDVAVKVISREWISCIGEDEEEVEVAIHRFEREVHAMAGIRHPNVLQIYDCGSEDVEDGGETRTVQYIVMEYIPGDTLRATMSELGFDPEEDLTRSWLQNFFFQVLDGVEAIHKAGMVHRDVKPENVLMDDQMPKIADFGLVRSCKMRAVTRSVDLKGTVMYMPPEQFMDFRGTDVRGDIYSLGKVLYEAIVGKIGAKDKALHFKTVGIENPESSFFEELDRIIRISTAEDREDRYQSVSEFRDALLAALAITVHGVDASGRNREEQIRPILKNANWIWAGIVIAVLSVGLMALYHIYFESPPGIDSKRPPKSARLVENSSLPSTVEPLLTKDGAMMLYVPGGDAPANDDPKDGRYQVEPFYMDETPVTNHQYVEFLNGVLLEVSVQNGVVLGQGSIWLILGEVVEGYEPILYKDGKFMVSHSGHAACPVLRVTAFGAQAYALIYNKRLPTRGEWIVAYNGGKVQSEVMEDGKDDHLPIPSPVLLYDKNRFGIRGLNQSINEWAVVSPEEQGAQETAAGPEFMVLGKFPDENQREVDLASVKRLPWEAFDHVGFRCVRDVKQNGSENETENRE